MPRESEPLLVCRNCGCVHHPVALRWRERALCSQCGTTLARHGTRGSAALAFTVTALILALPAAELPIVTVRKFGADRVSYLWSGIQALWQNGMPLLSIWVAFCGIAVPLLLLATLFVVVMPARFTHGHPAGAAWLRLGHALQHWSMPEVQVLAVLVAFVKIGALVQVEVGAGLWFYGAMAAMLLLAWRSAELLEVTK